MLLIILKYNTEILFLSRLGIVLEKKTLKVELVKLSPDLLLLGYLMCFIIHSKCCCNKYVCQLSRFNNHLCSYYTKEYQTVLLRYSKIVF